jgi:predicted Zn-dependent protease
MVLPCSNPKVSKSAAPLEGVAVNRPLILLACLVALILGWAAYSGQLSHPANATALPLAKIEGSKIYFVPIGDFPRGRLDLLAQYYRQKYHLEITVLNSIPVDPATRNESRQQLMAEQLVASLRNGVPDHAQRSEILIGFTSEDMYPTSQNWQFAFGWRQFSMGAAVVSTARMSLHYDGEPLDPNLSDIRLRKTVTKDIGILYYDMSPSQNPKSVLYNQILGIQELDEVGEEF